MVIALLMLIVFCILVPGFMRGLFSTILLIIMLAAFGWLPTSQAAPVYDAVTFEQAVTAKAPKGGDWGEFCTTFARNGQYAMYQRYDGQSKFHEYDAAEKAANGQDNLEMMVYPIEIAYSGTIGNNSLQRQADIDAIGDMLNRRCLNFHGQDIKPCMPVGFRGLNPRLYRKCD